jgi:DNA-binding transcriptional ArsR family regulator
LTGKFSLAYGSGVGDLFRALADPTRRTILDELRERDGQTLFELCARLSSRHGLGLTRQAISQHLDVLEDAGLVISRRSGRYKFHHLDTTPLRAITERWPPPAAPDPEGSR